jgi:hypothetical protein
MDKNERLDEYYKNIDRLSPAKGLIIAVLLGFILDLSIVLVIFLILDLL